MELGLLEYSVDHIVGGLRIKWEHVLRLTSDQPLDIELGNGQFYFGSFVESSADGELRIQTAAGEFDVKMADVVLIEPIKSSFWKRFDGNLSTGLSFAKASDLCSSASVALRHIAL